MASSIEPSADPVEELSQIAAWVGDDAISSVLKVLASLRLTVCLFALSIFLILAGTLAQVDKDIWLVIEQYFRCGIAWIDLKIFFPPAFFPNGLPEFLSKIIFDEDGISRQFPFPGGWMIGAMMSANLLAAHIIRFKKQARGARLGIGLLVIALGLVATWFVVVSGMSADGFQAETWLSYTQIWKLMLGTLGLGVAGLLYTSALMPPGSVEKRGLIGGGVLLGAALAYFLFQDSTGQLGDSSIRILWQLMKATFASLILLTGCILVFKKRAGIVLLHGGIGLMMLGEVVVGFWAVENQMRLQEGQKQNYVYDIREVELAAIDSTDPDEDKVVAIPESMLSQVKEDKPTLVETKELPFDIEVVEFMRNSDLRPIEADDDNRATAGTGLQYLAEKTDDVSGLSSATDIPSAYLKITDRESGKVVDTVLVSMWFSERSMMMNKPDRPEVITVDGKPWDLYLRFKRTYKPYSISLVDVRKDDYVGTNTPRNYSSDVVLTDPTRNVERPVKIWMNNPLRFAGETFYQSGYNLDESSGTEFTTLAIVKNSGWMIPYVSCMVVMVGMLAQFSISLFRFIKRRDRVAGTRSAAQLAVGPVAIPVVIALVMGLWMASKARTPSPSKTADFDLYKFGQLPVAYQGRVKPIDTVARNALRIISDREEYKLNAEDKPAVKQSAVEWLLDLVARPEVAHNKPIFRVEDLELLASLGLERRKGFKYSYNEIMEQEEELVKQAELARKAQKEKKLTHFTRKVLELEQHIGAMRMVQTAFRPADFNDEEPHTQLVDSFRKMMLLEDRDIPLAAMHSDDKNEADWKPFFSSSTVNAVREFAKRNNAKNSSELADIMIAGLPSETVGNTLRSLVPIMQEECKNKGVSYQELGSDMMERVGSDPYLSDVLTLVMQSPQNASADDILAATDATRITEIFAPRIQGTFMEMARHLPKRVLEPIAKRLPAAPTTPAAVMGILRQMTVGAIDDLMGPEGVAGANNQSAETITRALNAWKERKPSTFNSAVKEYHGYLAIDAPTGNHASATRFESFFNNMAPCYYPAFSYLFAIVLGLAAWLGFTRSLNRAAFAVIVVTFVFHTFGLGARMWISGRPPVTNLYSSAVFIGWGAVILGLVFEAVYRIGVGNLIAAISGASTLAIAHFLAGDGDTFKQLQAVLDTQFWLSTHVVTVTAGYAATFVAGLLGIGYIVRGVFSSKANADEQREVSRMIYGTLCFAILLSFVGTVLGGLWADDSWGRFWGWDPKENGALIIVLWNALVLHARWGKMVKDRGMAMLSIVGNIWTAWSWFGVNELGVGLHSYGFTDGVLAWLGIFVLSQLAILGLAFLPPSLWLSKRGDVVS